MNTYRKLLPPLVISTVLLAVLLAYAAAVRADLTFSEMALNPDGGAYEINAAPNGTLWVSDYGAEEIWAISPSGETYTVYTGTGSVSDARQAPDGTVWWAELTGDNLAQLDPTTLEMTTWEVPGATSLIGTAVDDLGRVWLSQRSAPEFFSFDPGTDELCTYTMSEENGGGSEYLLAQGGWIWLGDRINHRITRLDPDAGEFTYWQLESGSQPLGLAAGTDGSVWWADYGLDYIAQLRPDQNQQFIYHLEGGTPAMLAHDGATLWFSDYDHGSFGRLDPGTAAAVDTSTLITGTFTWTPECTQAIRLMSATLTTTTGTAEWGSPHYTQTVNENGWQIYQLPDDPNVPYDSPDPWGIAASGSDVWLVDNNRQVLSRIQSEVSLTACKLEDADGDPGTTGDRSPVEGWTINLDIEGADPTSKSTGADGCTTWEGLEAGKNYEVWEAMQDGWEALTPLSYTDTLVMDAEHTFINHQLEVDEDMHIYLPAILR